MTMPTPGKGKGSLATKGLSLSATKEHLSLTHESKRLEKAAEVYAGLLIDVCHGGGRQASGAAPPQERNFRVGHRFPCK